MIEIPEDQWHLNNRVKIVAQHAGEFSARMSLLIVEILTELRGVASSLDERVPKQKLQLEYLRDRISRFERMRNILNEV